MLLVTLIQGIETLLIEVRPLVEEVEQAQKNDAWVEVEQCQRVEKRM